MVPFLMEDLCLLLDFPTSESFYVATGQITTITKIVYITHLLFMSVLSARRRRSRCGGT